MERVVGEPHVFTAASDEIFAFGRIKIHRAGLEDAADVGLPGKNSRSGSAKNEVCVHAQDDKGQPAGFFHGVNGLPLTI